MGGRTWGGGPREDPVCLGSPPSFAHLSVLSPPGEELLQLFVNADQQWEQTTAARQTSLQQKTHTHFVCDLYYCKMDLMLHYTMFA